MLETILISLAVIIVAFVIVVAMRPSRFVITRTATIPAPVSVVFAQTNDFHKWVTWSPWEKFDPTMKRTFEGPAAGTGAIYKWSGNNKAGEGRATLIESRPNELVRIKLDYVRPFAGTNTAEFAFRPHGDQTVVTWSLTGTNSFMCKAVGLFMNMDKMIGTAFEEGLANLKSVVKVQT